jgi:hypothetical protein
MNFGEKYEHALNKLRNKYNAKMDEHNKAVKEHQRERAYRIMDEIQDIRKEISVLNRHGIEESASCNNYDKIFKRAFEDDKEDNNRFESKEDVDDRERFVDHLEPDTDDQDWREYEEQEGNEKIIKDFEQKIAILKDVLKTQNEKKIKEVLFQISELCREYTYLLENEDKSEDEEN